MVTPIGVQVETSYGLADLSPASLTMSISLSVHKEFVKVDRNRHVIIIDGNETGVIADR